MSTLAEQQDALLATLFSWPTSTAALQQHMPQLWLRGLQAYQANGHGLAERALAAVYPVQAALLGENSFSALARAYWHAQPPRRGDLSQWGGQLPGFLRASPQLLAEPYLGDVAELEWALHRCADAADLEPAPDTLALLVDHDPAGIELLLAPGSAVLTSAWPVVSIVTVHQQPEPDFASLGEKLHQHHAEQAVVWRAGYRPQLREGLAGEVPLLQALLRGESLAIAFEAAPDLDFARWIELALHSGLLLGARLRMAGG